jgi:hypothetical protein
MTISINHHLTGPIAVNKLLAALYDYGLVKEIALQAVANQVEAHIDMMCDFPSEYDSFKAARLPLTAAKVDVNDVINDLVNDFKQSLLDAIKSVEIEVESVEIDVNGFVNANVTVK